MPPTLDFESDPFLTLLTDALRAGPGSAEWAEAVVRLRTEGRDGPKDEYAMLVAAREDLARGRKYREVRAGPGFTRRVFGAIESDKAGTHRSLPLANLIAIISLTVVLALIGLGVYMFWPAIANQQAGNQAQTLPDLNRTLFTVPVETTRFEAAPSPAWKTFGSLPVQFTVEGLRVGVGADASVYAGGGLLLVRPFSASEPASMEVLINPPAAGRDVIVQMFMTDDPTFDEKSATTPHELVWLLRAGTMNVVSPDGHLVGEAALSKDAALPLKVRILSDQKQAIVYAGDQELFKGAHELDPGESRYLGIRILSRGEIGDNAPVIQSATIHVPFAANTTRQ